MRPITVFILVIMLVLCVSTSFCKDQQSLAEVVITDIANWKHPTKNVFEKHGIKLTKVVLQQNGVYPVFYAAMPGDPMLVRNDKDNIAFLLELGKANGWWDFTLVERGYIKVFAKFDRKKKILISWDFDDSEEIYLENAANDENSRDSQNEPKDQK